MNEITIPHVKPGDDIPVGRFYQDARDPVGDLTLEGELPEGVSGPIDFSEVCDSGFHVPVNGITFEDRTARFLEWILGEDCGVQLRREPDNQYDSNAVAVHAVWKNQGRRRSAKIGHLPKECAALLAAEFPEAKLGAFVARAYLPSGGRKSPGLRIFVGAEGAPSNSGIRIMHGDEIGRPMTVKISADGTRPASSFERMWSGSSSESHEPGPRYEGLARALRKAALVAALVVIAWILFAIFFSTDPRGSR
jgi:hypothetical protein